MQSLRDREEMKRDHAKTVFRIAMSIVVDRPSPPPLSVSFLCPQKLMEPAEIEEALSRYSFLVPSAIPAPEPLRSEHVEEHSRKRASSGSIPIVRRSDARTDNFLTPHRGVRKLQMDDGSAALTPGHCHRCKKGKEECVQCPQHISHRFCMACLSRHATVLLPRAFDEDKNLDVDTALLRLRVDPWKVWPKGCPRCDDSCPCSECIKRRLRLGIKDPESAKQTVARPGAQRGAAQAKRQRSSTAPATQRATSGEQQPCSLCSSTKHSRTITCASCKRSFHRHCVSSTLSRKSKSRNWKCTDCGNGIPPVLANGAAAVVPPSLPVMPGVPSDSTKVATPMQIAPAPDPTLQATSPQDLLALQQAVLPPPTLTAFPDSTFQPVLDPHLLHNGTLSDVGDAPPGF